MDALGPGRRFAGYEILKLLGRGAGGEVFLARDPELERLVALKILAAPAGPDQALSRARAEARAGAALQHPGIATLFAAGEADGRSYLAMEYVAGRSLRELLAGSPGSLPGAGQALEWVTQAAEALAFAHTRGFIHRDIKPENLAITTEGRLKLLDFGLAARPGLLDSLETISDHAAATTLDPDVVGAIGALRRPNEGTLAYMSPQQILGEPPVPADDLFALSVVLHELLAGRAPFRRPTAVETARAILFETPGPPAGRDRLARALARVADRGMRKKPAERYASAEAMLADLAAAGSAPRRGRRVFAAASILVLACLAAAAGALLWNRTRGSEGIVADPVDSRPEPFLLRPGLDADPAFSPDGRRVVFSHAGDLYVVAASTPAQPGDPVSITSGEGIDTQPEWSPDGSAIAFTREWPDGRIEIWRVPAGGGEAERVIVQGSTPGWSPEGDRLVFVQRGLGRSTSLLIVGSDGRLSRPLTHPEDAYFHTRPAWSPDGSTIAFVKDPGGGASAEIWLAPADGGAAQRLLREPDGIYATEPAWSPDGEWIIHVSNRGGTPNLWRISARGGEPQRLTAGGGRDSDPVVSPDGRRVLYQIYHSQTGLFAYDRSAGRETLLLDSPVGEPWGPAYSPDGSSIAYTRIDTAGPWDIHVMPAGGGTPRRLTSGSESALWPRWSPDGSQIAYCTFGKGDDDLFVVPAEGGAARQLTRGGGDDWWPSWSPDGTEIVFSRTDAGSTRLYRVRLAGGPPELIRDQSATLPHHSRDGALLAVAGDRGFWHGVGVMPSAGGPIRWLTDTGGWPVFRPDGRAVGFVRLDPGGRQSLWEVAVEGGEAYPIDGPEFSSWNYPFAYHPRGDGLVYSRSTGMEGDLWMIELPP